MRAASAFAAVPNRTPSTPTPAWACDRRRAAATLALLSTGCALTAPSAAAPAAEPAAVDARREFAPLFDQALALHGAGGTAASWLHDVEGAEPTASVRTRRRRFNERAEHSAVLIVPGLFGDCVAAQSVPFGDGQVRSAVRSPREAYARYAVLGLHTLRMVPLPGRAHAADNGALLAQALRAEATRPGVRRLVLVGYSKGVTDALHALARLDAERALPSMPLALVSVAGLVHGSLLVRQYQRLYEALLPSGALLDCGASDGRELQDLTPAAMAAWWQRHRLPRSVRAYSVTSHAPREAIAPALRPFHDELAAVDARNDGQLIAPHALLPGSTWLAEARSDHWGIALPLDRHPSALMRALAAGDAFEREALLTALLWWVLGEP